MFRDLAKRKQKTRASARVLVRLNLDQRIFAGVVLFFLSRDAFVDLRADKTTDDGSYPEEPQLRRCPITDKDRNTGASSRVNRGIRDGNTDQVDERQPETNRNRSQAFGRTIIGRAHDDEEEHRAQHDLSRQRSC